MQENKDPGVLSGSIGGGSLIPLPRAVGAALSIVMFGVQLGQAVLSNVQGGDSGILSGPFLWLYFECSGCHCPGLGFQLSWLFSDILVNILSLNFPFS